MIIKKLRVYLYYLLINIFYNFVKFTIFVLPFIIGSPKKFNLSRSPLLKKMIKKNFAIICGDDCELPTSKENYKIAKSLVKNKKDQYKINGKTFHPGVYVAVHDQLKNVVIKNGFWYSVVKN